MLVIDVLDTSGSLFALSRTAGLMDDRSGDFEGSSVAFLVDAICITFSSLMGLSPSTVFIESAAGIGEGGKTGLTAISTAFVFFLSLFFSPIFSSIPSYATGATLILVGSLMASNTAYINWAHPKDAIPAFLAITVIPFSFSIAYGLIAAILSWILLHNVPIFLHWASRGWIAMPPGWEEAEPYSASFMLAASTAGDPNASKVLAALPPWLRRAIKGKRDFWNMYPSELDAYLEGRKITAQRALKKKAEKEAEWAEEREAMMRIQEVGQPTNLPPHFSDYPPAAEHLKEDGSASDSISEEQAEKRMEEANPDLKYK